MKNLYHQETYQDCLDRINKLTSDTQPQWGKMNIAQMMAHCAEIQDVSNGKDLKGTPILVKLFKGQIRKMVVGPKPYKKETPTHPQYRMAATSKEFDTEKEHLLGALEQFFSEDQERSNRRKHPLFGLMTREEKGWSMFKHLDHHLSQFGV